MSLIITRRVIMALLLRAKGDNEFIQESPVLPEVWVQLGERPQAPVDLLVTPNRPAPADEVARVLSDALCGSDESSMGDRRDDQLPDVAPLHEVVAARVSLDELVHHLLPLTEWFRDGGLAHFRPWPPREGKRVQPPIGPVRAWVRGVAGGALGSESADDLPWRERERWRYWTVIGLLRWAQDVDASELDLEVAGFLSVEDLPVLVEHAEEIAEAAIAVLGPLRSDSDETPGPPLIWRIGCNRPAAAAVLRSVSAIKADAADRLFEVDTRKIRWAILDSGIDASHPAFFVASDDGVPEGPMPRSRVSDAFDFTWFRELQSYERLASDGRRQRVAERIARSSPLEIDVIHDRLKAIADDVKEGRPRDWAKVEPLLRLPKFTAPATGHGTHVAGILGANWKTDSGRHIKGVCPQIRLYDFRVLGDSIGDTEFAVVAALDYIRWRSGRDETAIHGVNMSLSIPHDVESHACGDTPVCRAAERLVGAGVVVVAAAGNAGYHEFETATGRFAGFQSISITDPANAENVIAVGATHRYRPHSYGVSYFSSRGPTADGRMKPDILAPGERIQAPLPFENRGSLSGTSMAAPHVSGAAAMLMARHHELRRQPLRIKQVLCDAATDLSREPCFQGHGFLDVLRALQSI